VYATDFANRRLAEFSSTGTFIKAYGWGVVDGKSEFETCTTATTCQAGVSGGGAGQFEAAYGVAVDRSSGNIYVADGNRIDEFSSAGSFVKAYGWGVLNGEEKFQTCTTVCHLPVAGEGTGQFNFPSGLATDPSGHVYVLDRENHRIEEFSSAGAFVKTYGWGVLNGEEQFQTCTTTCRRGNQGGGAGQLTGAGAEITTDSSGNLYVPEEHRVDEFSSAGSFTKAFGWGVLDGKSEFETCTATCQAGVEAPGAGAFTLAAGAAFDGSGNLYVTDAASYRVQEFDSAGNFLLTFGWGVSDGAARFEVCKSSCQGGILGSGPGQFYSPFGAAVGNSGTVYIADYNNSRIDEFGSAGPAPNHTLTVSLAGSGGGSVTGAGMSCPVT
jgi:DNA-binding beta-propeller fold protein YncE